MRNLRTSAALGSLSLLMLVSAGCEFGLPAGDEPHREFNFLDMADQPKLKPQRAAPLRVEAPVGAVSVDYHPYPYAADQGVLAGRQLENCQPQAGKAGSVGADGSVRWWLHLGFGVDAIVTTAFAVVVTKVRRIWFYVMPSDVACVDAIADAFGRFDLDGRHHQSFCHAPHQMSCGTYKNLRTPHEHDAVLA